MAASGPCCCSFGTALISESSEHRDFKNLLRSHEFAPQGQTILSTEIVARKNVAQINIYYENLFTLII